MAVPLRREVLLASRGRRPGLLLNTLKHTEQLPTTKNHPGQNVNSAKAENLCIKWTKQVEKKPQEEGRAGAKALRWGRVYFQRRA